MNHTLKFPYKWRTGGTMQQVYKNHNRTLSKLYKKGTEQTFGSLYFYQTLNGLVKARHKPKSLKMLIFIHLKITVMKKLIIILIIGICASCVSQKQYNSGKRRYQAFSPAMKNDRLYYYNSRNQTYYFKW